MYSMFYRIFILLGLILCWNCKSSAEVNQDFINEVPSANEEEPKSNINFDSLAVKSKDILPLNSENKKVVAFGEKKEGEKFILSFEVTTQTKAFIKLSTANDLANLRINQIIMPDQKSEGPFGKDAEFPLYQGGTYQIVIAESLMQGNPYQGKFKVEIELK